MKYKHILLDRTEKSKLLQNFFNNHARVQAVRNAQLLTELLKKAGLYEP